MIHSAGAARDNPPLDRAIVSRLLISKRGVRLLRSPEPLRHSKTPSVEFPAPPDPVVVGYSKPALRLILLRKYGFPDNPEGNAALFAMVKGVVTGCSHLAIPARS